LIKKLGLALLALVLLSPVYVHAAPGTIPVDLQGTSYNVKYDVDGVKILSAVTDLDFISLLLEVEVTSSPGILEITLDRSFFDSTFQGVDEAFIVIADGDEPNVDEIGTNSQSRTLRIELPLGTEDVEIIGTSFGTSQTVIEEPEEPPEEPETPTEEPPEEPETPTEEPEEPPKEPKSTTGEPKTKCGSGTVLKDGVCVLDEKCGTGTVLQDGQCVALPSEPSDVSTSKDFIIGGGAALVIAFIVIIILAAIARVSRKQNN
jgi:hypothetical protein